MFSGDQTFDFTDVLPRSEQPCAWVCSELVEQAERSCCHLDCDGWGGMRWWGSFLPLLLQFALQFRQLWHLPCLLLTWLISVAKRRIYLASVWLFKSGTKLSSECWGPACSPGRAGGGKKPNRILHLWQPSGAVRGRGLESCFGLTITLNHV